MKYLSAVVVLFCLLVCSHAGLINFLKEQRPAGIPILCKSLPLPSLDTDALLSKLQPYLEQVDQKVQGALKDDNSTGGAVLSVVYRNATIWTKGYGLIDISSEFMQSVNNINIELYSG